jgi:CBS-domain-containing membrane protein
MLARIAQYIRSDRRLSTNWRRYVVQSVLAMVTMLALMLLLSSRRGAVVASIAASTFIVFAMPSTRPARPRNLIGGHLIGLTCGALVGLIPHHSPFITAGLYALCVGCSVFLMVALHMEHPPAAGTALGVALDGFSATLFLSVLVCIVTLAAVRVLLGPKLLDLV